MKRLSFVGAAAALAALALTPSALAHVTVNPNEATAGSFSRFAVRVPTERPVATTSVSLQLPEGLFFVSFQPKPGWTREVKMETLAEPVELFGTEYTERVAEVTWSGGTIGPGEFEEFGMSARMPDLDPGAELVFPAVQTYESGEVVRWIGEPDSDAPAPRVALAETADDEAAAVADDTSTRETLALVLAIIALVASLVALGRGFVGRRA